MSRPIKLTDELLKNIQEEFIAKVKSMKMFDGKLEYSRTFKWEDSENDKATIFLSSVAFAKMNALIQQFDSEVAWHGVVHRDEEDPTIFRIMDILVYPQVVSGVTVNTDQDAYQTWLYAFDDDVFNNIRMQGHSHVNMGVSPSGVDTTHQEKILGQIRDDDYYIFMIWNKRYEHFVRIFDLKNNTLYETADVDVLIGDEGMNLNEFVKSAKEIVKPKTYAPTYTPSIYGYQGRNMAAPQPQSKVTPIAPAATGQAAVPEGVKTKPKETKGGTTGIGRSFQEYGGDGWGEDYNDPYFAR